ncbi:hypothetical protein ACOSQ3_021532 [Xanthoceras sorbifolium]
MLHGNKPLVVEDFVPWSFLFHEDFVAPNQRVGQVVAPASPASWKPPPPLSVKINTDAAVSSTAGIVGLGIVIRNHDGAVIAATAQRLRQPFSVLVAEAMGILQGLPFAKHLVLLPASLESDSLSVVNEIHRAPSLANLALVILDI